MEADCGHSFSVIWCDCYGYRMKQQIVAEMVCVEILKVHFTDKETETQENNFFIVQAGLSGIPVKSNLLLNPYPTL